MIVLVNSHPLSPLKSLETHLAASGWTPRPKDRVGMRQRARDPPSEQCLGWSPFSSVVVPSMSTAWRNRERADTSSFQVKPVASAVDSGLCRSAVWATLVVVLYATDLKTLLVYFPKYPQFLHSNLLFAG